MTAWFFSLSKPVAILLSVCTYGVLFGLSFGITFAAVSMGQSNDNATASASETSETGSAASDSEAGEDAGDANAATPEPTEEPWQLIEDDRFNQTFKIPPDWSVVENGATDFENDGVIDYVSLNVLDASGTKVLEFASGPFQGGGTCSGDNVADIIELDSVPVDAPGYVPSDYSNTELHAAFRAAEWNGRVVTSYALSDRRVEPSCMFTGDLYDEQPATFSTGWMIGMDASSLLSFDSMDEAKEYMKTEEHQDTMRVLESLTF